ncbi:MAG: SDR family oxidoreductase [Hyphomonas sp.]|jgi:3-oxoacyl-[acyl-carrier protein] reductase|nr:SDR family oxidoreductase [Hyphomonas sp.]
MMPAKNDDRLTELHAGQSASVDRTVTSDDVAAFAQLSGDYNALHIDQEFAARTEFSRPVAHGFLHASLLSTLIGMKLPGRGALYLSQTIEFSAPVFIGDSLVAAATIDKIDRDTRIVDLSTIITNQRGQAVLRGKARAKVLRLAPNPAPASSGNKLDAGARHAGLVSGKRALITGASRGIGRATARLLAAQGAHVCINYRHSMTAAATLCDEIAAEGGQCMMVKADVTSARSASALVDAAAGAAGIDILVNNAGPRITSAPFARVSWEQMAEAYQAIAGSAFNVTQAALPHLRKSSGRIINVISSAALGRTAFHWMPYAAAKAALHAMSKNLALELGPSGITVNTVSPSLVATDLVSDMPERVRQDFMSRTPLRRLATVDDVAGAILLLASPYASFITGDNLLVAGGEIMS